jgi:hypothetical protein
MPEETSHAAEPPPPPIHFDGRIDRIGFANELQRQFIDDIKSDVKISLLEADIAVAEGKFFQALLVESAASITDVAKLFKLAEKREIPLTKLQACLRVDRAAAKKIFGEMDLDRISTKAEPTQSLTVKRKAGVEIALVEALAQLSSAAAAKAASNPSGSK